MYSETGPVISRRNKRKENKPIVFYVQEELLPYLFLMCAFQYFFLRRLELDEKIKLSENYKDFTFHEEIIAP